MVTDDTDPRPDDRLEDVDSLAGRQILLTQQVDEILNETTAAVEVADHLDLSMYAREDPYPDWHDSKTFEPMLRTILSVEFEDASDAWRHRTLETDPDTTAELGFDPNDVPDQSLLQRTRRTVPSIATLAGTDESKPASEIGPPLIG